MVRVLNNLTFTQQIHESFDFLQKPYQRDIYREEILPRSGRGALPPHLCWHTVAMIKRAATFRKLHRKVLILQHHPVDASFAL